MPLYIEAGQSRQSTPAPEGLHRAVCIGVYDLGTSKPKGEYKAKRKLRITWELADEFMDDGRPFVVGETYTRSLHEESRLRPALQSWRGKAFTAEELKRFDVGTLLGKPCMVNVIHEPARDGGDRMYAVVASLARLPKGMEAPTPVNPAICFDIGESGGRLPDGMPEWIAKRVQESPEWKKLLDDIRNAHRGAEQSQDDGDPDLEEEDIPF